MTEASGEVGEALRGLRQLRKEAEELNEETSAPEPPVEKPEAAFPVEEQVNYTEDVVDDSLSSARDVGTLERGYNRLNVMSQLHSGGDEVDNFKFDVSQPGRIQMQRSGDPDVRIKMIGEDGTVFADSGAQQGSDARKNYTKLVSTGLDVGDGNYAIRAERPEGADPETPKAYGVSLNQGPYRVDQDTIETAGELEDDELEAAERAEPKGSVDEYTKKTTAVADEGLDDARDIGRLVENRSRLNVVTQLTEEQEKDHFRFDVHRSGEARLGGYNTEQVRVELLNADREVIADSGAEADSELGENYNALAKGRMTLEEGEHYLRVTREDDVGEDKSVNYGLQLTQGSSYSKDYTVIEQGVEEKQTDPVSQATAAGGLNNGQAALSILGGATTPGAGGVIQESTSNIQDYLDNQQGGNDITNPIAGSTGLDQMLAATRRESLMTVQRSLQNVVQEQNGSGGGGGGTGGLNRLV